MAGSIHVLFIFFVQNLTLAIFRTFGYIKSADIRIKNLTLPIDRACHFTSKVTGRVFYHFAFEKSYDRKTEILMGFCRIIPSPGQEHFSRRKIEKIFFAFLDISTLGKLKSLLDPMSNLNISGVMAKNRKPDIRNPPYLGSKSIL